MQEPKKELVEQFINVMLKTRQIMHGSSNTSLKEKIVTILQIKALSFLKDKPNTTVGEIGKQLNMSSASIAQFCDRLVKTSWIERKNDKSDRRVIHLSLTKIGEKELKSVKEKRFKKLNSVL